jgi:hypothetical protein
MELSVVVNQFSVYKVCITLGKSGAFNGDQHICTRGFP